MFATRVVGQHQVSLCACSRCNVLRVCGPGPRCAWWLGSLCFVLHFAVVVWFGASEKKNPKNNGNGALGVWSVPRSDACDIQRTPGAGLLWVRGKICTAQSCTGNMRIPQSRRRGGITGACMHGLDLIFGVMISYSCQNKGQCSRRASRSFPRVCLRTRKMNRRAGNMRSRRGARETMHGLDCGTMIAHVRSNFKTPINRARAACRGLGRRLRINWL